MHGPSFFSFHFLSFPISFPKLANSCLYMACKKWKVTTALTWEIWSWRLLEKFYIPAFPIHYSLYNWIGEHETTNLKKMFASNPEKEYKNKDKKTWMEWNYTKWTICYFQQCACVNAIYFAQVVTTTHRMKNSKRSNRNQSLEISVLAIAHAQLLNVLYISTHLSVPHGENI